METISQLEWKLSTMLVRVARDLSFVNVKFSLANMLCGAKTQANPESTVGILSMAGKRVELLVSPTDDMGKILNGLHNIAIGGECRFANAIRVAQLALKHRREKKGAQRLVIFVASPIVEDEKTLTKIGKLLKKNNVCITNTLDIHIVFLIAKI